MSEPVSSCGLREVAALRSDVDQDRDVLDLEEIRQAIDGLTTVELVRLRKAGRIYAVGLACDVDDLIGEAVAAAIAGNRRCRRDMMIVPFLVGAMRSIASKTRVSAKRAGEVISLDATGTDGRPMVAPPISHEPDVETLWLREEDRKLRIEALEELFADDEDALLMIWADLEETPKEEIKMQHDIDDKAYATIRRRIRRKIERRFPDGWTA